MSRIATNEKIGKNFIWVDVQDNDVEQAKKWCSKNCTTKYSYACKIHEEFNVNFGFMFSSPSDATLFKMVWHSQT